MTDRPGRGQLARKMGILTAVAATGFLCGWSALGMTDGVVLAIALLAGVAAPVFRNEPKICRVYRRWSR